MNSAEFILAIRAKLRLAYESGRYYAQCEVAAVLNDLELGRDEFPPPPLETITDDAVNIINENLED